MRRFAISLAALGALALSACSGGGSVLSFGANNSPDYVIITPQGGLNIPRVLAGAELPLSAQAFSGKNHGFVNNNRFHWSAVVVNDASYVVNTLGGTKPCAPVTIAPGGVPPFVPYAPDYSVYIAIDPVNEANIIFVPPAFIPVPTGSIGQQVGSNAYCVRVSATTVDGGITGSTIVAVVNPATPLQ